MQIRRLLGAAVAATAALLVVPLAAPSAGPDLTLGRSASAVAPASVPGATKLADGRWAVPLRADKPSWLTPELELAARQNKGKPTPAPEEAPDPGGSGFAVAGPPVDGPAAGYVGIRPGSWMIAPSGCTMNFVFGTPGSYSIGTAGHCVEAGQDVILLTAAPPNQDVVGTGVPVLVNIGTATRSVDGGVGNDFAIVPVRPELQSWVYPTIAQVGGPCGAYTGDGTLPDIASPFRGANPVEAGEAVFHYGHGLAIGTGGTPRAGAATGWTADAFYWDSPSIFGDSGSAVRIQNLQAAGDLTHLVVDTRVLPGVVAGTRISKMISLAGQPLANSPYCP